jgi:Leucine-rich repeat (LRR) protein
MSDLGLYITCQSTSGPIQIEVPYDTIFLQLDHMNLVDIDMSQIKKLPNLERIHLNNNKLRTLDLSPLRNCKNLQWIQLSHNSLEEIDLEPLSAISKITNLELGSNELTKIDLSPLRKHPSLSTLILSNNRIEKIDISPLAQCKRLNMLYLSGNRLTELSLVPLTNHQSLTYLDISRNSLKELNLTPLENIDSLTFLYLSENKLETINLPSFRHEGLPILVLSNNRLTEIDFNPLRGCLKLTELDLSGNRLNRIDLSPLSTIRTLQHLFLLDNPLEFVDLTPLLYSLRDCKFSTQERKSRKLAENTDVDELYSGWSTKPLEFGEGSIISKGYNSGDLILYIASEIPVLIDKTFKSKIEQETKNTERITWVEQPSLIKKSVANRWAQLVSLLEYFPLDAVYSALCMNELRGYGLEIMTLARNISGDLSYEEGRMELYTATVKALELKLGSNYSTKHLDVTVMMNTEAVLLVPTITKLRKQEVVSLSLVMEGENVDIRPLRETYIGALLLNEMNHKSWKADRDLFVRIKEKLAEVEINLKNPKGW